MTVALTLQVNRKSVAADVAPGTLLVDFMRSHLRLTGTHQACDTVQCGACTILLNGQAIKSCNRLAVQCAGQSVDTIEGLAGDTGTLHPMQALFSKHHALQCGYCTPGFVMRAMAMVHEDVPAEPDAVRRALSGNLCRCTGYEGIVSAICEGLVILRGAPLPVAAGLTTGGQPT